MNELLSSGPDADWSPVAQHLDAGLGELGDADRDVLLLRYFEKKSAREMAAMLGISEDAAQKRVSRAIDRLRECLIKRKITVSAIGLGTLILANAVQSAPVGLGTTITTAVAGTTTTIGMTMIQKLLIAALAAAVAGTGLYSTHLQKQAASLRRQQESLAQQVRQLGQERDDAKNQLAALQLQNEQLSSNTELLKLRSELAQLRSRPGAATETPAAGTNHLSRPKRISVRVGTEFVIFPVADLPTLGVAWTADNAGGQVGLLTTQRLAVINKALSGASDATILSSPSIINDNGMTGQSAILHPVPADGTNFFDVGLDVTTTATYSTNSSSFDLKLETRLHHLAGDLSQPQLLTARTTNQLDILPGKIAVVEREFPGDGWMPGFYTNDSPDPRCLLIFVTPAIVDPRDYERPGPKPGTVQRTAAIIQSAASFNESSLSTTNRRNGVQ